MNNRELSDAITSAYKMASECASTSYDGMSSIRSNKSPLEDIMRIHLEGLLEIQRTRAGFFAEPQDHSS